MRKKEVTSVCRRAAGVPQTVPIEATLPLLARIARHYPHSRDLKIIDQLPELSALLSAHSISVLSRRDRVRGTPVRQAPRRPARAAPPPMEGMADRGHPPAHGCLRPPNGRRPPAQPRATPRRREAAAAAAPPASSTLQAPRGSDNPGAAGRAVDRRRCPPHGAPAHPMRRARGGHPAPHGRPGEAGQRRRPPRGARAGAAVRQWRQVRQGGQLERPLFGAGARAAPDLPRLPPDGRRRARGASARATLRHWRAITLSGTRVARARGGVGSAHGAHEQQPRRRLFSSMCHTPPRCETRAVRISLTCAGCVFLRRSRCVTAAAPAALACS